jgi:hypothetical protein
MIEEHTPRKKDHEEKILMLPWVWSWLTWSDTKAIQTEVVLNANSKEKISKMFISPEDLNNCRQKLKPLVVKSLSPSLAEQLISQKRRLKPIGLRLPSHHASELLRDIIYQKSHLRPLIRSN